MLQASASRHQVIACAWASVRNEGEGFVHLSGRPVKFTVDLTVTESERTNRNMDGGGESGRQRLSKTKTNWLQLQLSERKPETETDSLTETPMIEKGSCCRSRVQKDA